LIEEARQSGGNVIVVDASVLTVALGDDEVDGRTARARIHGESPELIDLEVASVLRRRVG
jgi:predicted nucleic acid-binding protein